MTFELPLFPLNTVLFPGMSLPLHIFEPRYQLMIRRCLDADTTFGVLLMTEGHEGRKAGTSYVEIGCTAQITSSKTLAQGRMNIQTVGQRRFSVISVREHDEYLLGQCRWLEDEPPEEQVTLTASQVREAVRRYLVNLATDVHITGADPRDIEIPHDPFQLSMWTASLISLTNSQKQTLLEMTSTLARLEAEYSFLRRTEIVRLAWLDREENGPPPHPQDEQLGALSPFVSLN